MSAMGVAMQTRGRRRDKDGNRLWSWYWHCRRRRQRQGGFGRCALDDGRRVPPVVVRRRLWGRHPGVSIAFFVGGAGVGMHTVGDRDILFFTDTDETHGACFFLARA